jgi:hypothetical protein
MIRHQNADAMVLASALMRDQLTQYILLYMELTVRDIPLGQPAILNTIRGVNISHKRTG